MESIVQPRDQNGIYEEPKELSELLSMSFQKCFTKESMFETSKGEMNRIRMWEIEVTREEVKEVLGELHVRKA